MKKYLTKNQERHLKIEIIQFQIEDIVNPFSEPNFSLPLRTTSLNYDNFGIKTPSSKSSPLHILLHAILVPAESCFVSPPGRPRYRDWRTGYFFSFAPAELEGAHEEKRWRELLCALSRISIIHNRSRIMHKTGFLLYIMDRKTHPPFSCFPPFF